MKRIITLLFAFILLLSCNHKKQSNSELIIGKWLATWAPMQDSVGYNEVWYFLKDSTGKADVMKSDTSFGSLKLRYFFINDFIIHLYMNNEPNFSVFQLDKLNNDSLVIKDITNTPVDTPTIYLRYSRIK